MTCGRAGLAKGRQTRPEEGACDDDGDFFPLADVVVTDEDVRVCMDLPGVGPDNLEIELENDVLTVRGEWPFPYQAEDGNAASQRIERGFGKFERVLRVPRGLS